MKLETYIVNAFTEEIACGNPAGVVLLQEDLSQELMQRIAFDINKSETAFVKRTGHSEFHIRWFAPLTEVPICGHATLGASKVIFHNNPNLSEIKFFYKDGMIAVNQDKGGNIAMLFPLDEYKIIDIDPEFYEFFNLREIKACIQGVNTRKVILILGEEVELRNIKPDYRRMKESKGKSDYGIGITKLSKQYDFESRYFNPWYGVDEDPVTGSVHTVLANYWGGQLNKEVMTAYQNSQRPGELILSIKNGGMVEIKGKARIFIKGHIEV
jgi:PhzF family phenazine biosynthesis protein